MKKIGIERTKGNRLRDFPLYLAIAILIAILAIALGVHQAVAARGSSPSPLLLKWVGFGVMTLLVFSWAIRRQKPLSRNGRFWMLLGIFAAIHLSVGIGSLEQITTASLIPFVVATPFEYLLLRAYLSHFSSEEMRQEGK